MAVSRSHKNQHQEIILPSNSGRGRSFGRVSPQNIVAKFSSLDVLIGSLRVGTSEMEFVPSRKGNVDLGSGI